MPSCLSSPASERRIPRLSPRLQSTVVLRAEQNDAEQESRKKRADHSGQPALAADFQSLKHLFDLESVGYEFGTLS
jgi:hypothetical protein